MDAGRLALEFMLDSRILDVVTALIHVSREVRVERLGRDCVFGADRFAVSAKRRYHPSEPVVMHTHDFLEVAYIVRGRAIHVSPSGSVPVEPRMLVAIRPGQRHTYEACENIEVYNVALGPELLLRELLWTLDLPGLARFLLRGGTSAEPLDERTGLRLEAWLDQLASCAAPAGTPEAAVALGLAGCALGEMAKAEFEHTTSGRRISSPVREAMRLMTEAPAANWTMSELARQTSVSIAHLHRLFSAEVGSSPMAWLTKTRVEIAASMLIQGTLSIAEIAHRTGWSDPNHFSRRFRQLTGDTPSDHRTRFGLNRSDRAP